MLNMYRKEDRDWGKGDFSKKSERKCTLQKVDLLH